MVPLGKVAGVATASFRDSLTPAVGIMFAVLLLADVPDTSQFMGPTIIVGCVALARWPSHHGDMPARSPERSMAGN